jgi:hypothetical protein
MDRRNAVKEETDEKIAEIPPCVGDSGCEDDCYESTDEKDDRAIEYQVCKPKNGISTMRSWDTWSPYHSGKLRTPFEYCSALTPLKRSIVGYKAKKAG